MSALGVVYPLQTIFCTAFATETPATQRERTIQRPLAQSPSDRTERRPAMPATSVKYILSPSEIPVGQNYVLVKYGAKYEETRLPLGLTITVARQKSKTVSKLSFLTAAHTAKSIGKREGIFEIFACK
jgi:hypothetical protein